LNTSVCFATFITNVSAVEQAESLSYRIDFIKGFGHSYRTKSAINCGAAEKIQLMKQRN